MVHDTFGVEMRQFCWLHRAYRVIEYIRSLLYASLQHILSVTNFFGQIYIGDIFIYPYRLCVLDVNDVNDKHNHACIHAATL
jgi:hypothetical protein